MAKRRPIQSPSANRPPPSATNQAQQGAVQNLLLAALPEVDRRRLVPICYRMSADAFRREMDQRGAFYELLIRYSQAFVGAVMQATACNAVHLIEQRLARWLLLAHDRMGTDEFPLTQEFVAMMLGATRPTVTVVARTLQKAGLITYRRGRVTILDRNGLESASCECYRAATRLLRGVTFAAAV
jgi:hypothetical protein